MPTQVARKPRRIDRSPVVFDDRQVTEVTQRLKLVSDETRLRILSILSQGELNVTALCERVGLAQPAVSHHLALLRVSGLIIGERQGKNILYSLDDAGWATMEGCRQQLEW